MKQWYFSLRDEVTGPLGLTEANEFIALNPDAYVWQSSFSQWMPASHIDEFDLHLTPPPPPGAIPPQLLEPLSTKEQDLYRSLEALSQRLEATEQGLRLLACDIQTSRENGQSLNQEVNATLRSINEQYEALQKRLAGLTHKPGGHGNA